MAAAGTIPGVQLHRRVNATRIRRTIDLPLSGVIVSFLH